MYLPFLDGKYSVAPALQPLKKVANDYDKRIFQVDHEYQKFQANKEACRKENIEKYYQEKRPPVDTAVTVNQFIVQQLLQDYPDQFIFVKNGNKHVLTNTLNGEELLWLDDWLQVKNPKYHSLFDALACQVQEDLAICQLKDEEDWIAALHICSANHWAPAEKAGKPFDSIHAIVPGMEKTMVHYFKMLLSAVNKGPFTRFAWGISTDDRLNHHPIPAPGTDAKIWQGRQIEQGCELFVRVEKQTLTGLPEHNAFFFTIRTYFYPVSLLSQDEKTALVAAVESMSEPSLRYKGLYGKVEVIRTMLLP